MSDLDKLTSEELNRLKQIRAGEYLMSLRTERNLTQKMLLARSEFNSNICQKSKKETSPQVTNYSMILLRFMNLG
jgi:hypothetical protein